jgi:hypothetical protein
MLQPDTYVGNIKKHTQALWVYENDNMVYWNVTFVPGLYKTFDNTLVNVVDNKQRDPSMDCVKVLPQPISLILGCEDNLLLLLSCFPFPWNMWYVDCDVAQYIKNWKSQKEHIFHQRGY